MSDITFRRKGAANKNGSVPGELTIGGKTWPTIERGGGFTFVRKGTYKLLMCFKTRGRKVQCLCFSDDPSISSHLIHDALNDNHQYLEGCIAPGLTSDEKGIKKSAEAMQQVFVELGGFQEWTTKTITVENNMVGEETKEQWIKRRQKK